ncbi:MAG TPA: glycosyltransferase family A protein, partial [Candidatus Dormibacteraeota bacterium]|nr:glycosyltransferase family A protein [Candidatus Dormibacteraeota bacterium]
MASNIITVIPVYNGAKFIRETLESVAKQTLQPDRLVVLDNCSTDNTEAVVKGFQALKVEWIRNPKNLGLFGNCNRALEFAPEAKYLNLLCADDLIQPEFYSTLTRELESCDGLGLGYSLDERIDENGKHLSISGKPDGSSAVIP